ncbi:MAG TPA: NYN domain-containing protein [Thermoanaerobaculia bacterium]|nr:NYN domain-containing protein [Thermoanaerobaculia bacterium]
MTPWWLRPTADGAANEADDKQRTDEAPRDDAQSALPAAAERAPEPPPPAPAEPAAFDRAEHVHRAEPYEPSPRPSRFDRDEFREDDSLEAPAYAREAGRAEPAEAVSMTAMSPMPATDDADDEPQPGAGPEGERGEASTEKKSGRSRSRRGRGGRRKSGRTAAETPETTDEDDDESEETGFDEPPQIVPIAAASSSARPSHRRERDSRQSENFFSPADLEAMSREIIVSVPERPRSHSDERKIALFCDLENIALGVRDSEIAKFDINRVLERLLEKGKIIVKKAYADWERYSDYKRPFHEAAIELIDIPQKYYSGKNSADIKMVVDAMDLSYSKEHLDTFVLLSGDSDFSPLVSKLKENNKYVIGIGVKNSSSNLLVDNCDEFIYYEDVWRDSAKAPQLAGLTKKAAEAFSLMVESIQALSRENKDVLWGSMIKQTMQRKKPSFNEGYYGYSTFSELLEDAERKNIIKLKKDQRSGTYIVTGFAKR